MKKNSIIKTLMKFFALLASISGLMFLFRDKILSSQKIKEYMESNPDSPLCSKLSAFKTASTNEEEVDEDEEAFEHAFDEDPATSREYVSLNINPHRETLDSEDASFHE